MLCKTLPFQKLGANLFFFKWIASSMYNWGFQSKNLKMEEPNFFINFRALKKLFYKGPE